ncbi:MFS transporter [Actinoplanes sp. NPDC026670]|uniref:MFS transporter n=1 Tax=Actinoplanes sp. NPDC026670 TaxID=3154700 RepID=UPI0033D3CD2C
MAVQTRGVAVGLFLTFRTLRHFGDSEGGSGAEGRRHFPVGVPLALNWLILSATGSATAMGAVVMLQSLPVLLLGSWGGALADRLPARLILITFQAVRALLALALLLPGLPQPGLLPSGLLLLGGNWPISVVALASALALGSVLSSASRIGGMTLGGVLIGVTSPSALFVINAMSYLAVILALLAMRLGDMRPLAVAPPSEGGIVAGFRYLVGQPVIMVVLALSFVLGSLGRDCQVSMAAMCPDRWVGRPVHTVCCRRCSPSARWWAACCWPGPAGRHCGSSSTPGRRCAAGPWPRSASCHRCRESSGRRRSAGCATTWAHEARWSQRARSPQWRRRSEGWRWCG